MDFNPFNDYEAHDDYSNHTIHISPAINITSKFFRDFFFHIQWQNFTQTQFSQLSLKVLNLFPEHPYENLFKGISPVLLYFASVCCVLFMLLGIPGNLCTIIALARCKKVS